MRRVSHFAVALLLTLVWATAVYGQITVPAENPRDKIIDATVVIPGAPPNAQLLGTLSIPGADWRDVGGGKYCIVAPPGSYLITAQGWWITTREVKLPDEPEPVKVITGMGPYQVTAPFKVTGTINPPPPPPGKKQLAFFYRAEETERLPVGQRNLIKSLVQHEQIAKAGHVLLAVLDDGSIQSSSVPAELKLFVEAVKGATLPAVVYTSVDGGDVFVKPLPQDVTALLEVLK